MSLWRSIECRCSPTVMLGASSVLDSPTATIGNCTMFFSPKPLEDRRRLDIAMADFSPSECALALLLFWRPNLASGQPKPANAPIMDVEPDPPPVLPPRPDETEPKLPWVSLSEYNPPSKTPPPSHIRASQRQGAWHRQMGAISSFVSLTGSGPAEDSPGAICQYPAAPSVTC